MPIPFLIIIIDMLEAIGMSTLKKIQKLEAI